MTADLDHDHIAQERARIRSTYLSPDRPPSSDFSALASSLALVA